MSHNLPERGSGSFESYHLVFTLDGEAARKIIEISGQGVSSVEQPADAPGIWKNGAMRVTTRPERATIMFDLPNGAKDSANAEGEVLKQGVLGLLALSGEQDFTVDSLTFRTAHMTGLPVPVREDGRPTGSIPEMTEEARDLLDAARTGKLSSVAPTRAEWESVMESLYPADVIAPAQDFGPDAQAA